MTSRRKLLKGLLSSAIAVQALPPTSATAATPPTAAVAAAVRTPPAARAFVLVDGWVLTEADVARMSDAV